MIVSLKIINKHNKFYVFTYDINDFAYIRSICGALQLHGAY